MSNPAPAPQPAIPSAAIIQANLHVYPAAQVLNPIQNTGGAPAINPYGNPITAVPPVMPAHHHPPGLQFPRPFIRAHVRWRRESSSLYDTMTEEETQNSHYLQMAVIIRDCRRAFADLYEQRLNAAHILHRFRPWWYKKAMLAVIFALLLLSMACAITIIALRKRTISMQVARSYAQMAA
ncbi:hypothetical protein EDC01DRAFT_634168 [Geopyxis carbonaria]|nr:hypothetical protein EDC01DRAFT_634168 [Geopyxis carbonaria]